MAGYAELGEFVFSCIVYVVNIKLLVSCNQIGWGIMLLIALSMLSYFCSQAILSYLFASWDHFGTLKQLLSHPYHYMALILFICTFAEIDRVSGHVGRAIKDLRLQRKLGKVVK